MLIGRDDLLRTLAAEALAGEVLDEDRQRRLLQLLLWLSILRIKTFGWRSRHAWNRGMLSLTCRDRGGLSFGTDDSDRPTQACSGRASAGGGVAWSLKRVLPVESLEAGKVSVSGHDGNPVFDGQGCERGVGDEIAAQVVSGD
jgi:hypothetical protein